MRRVLSWGACAIALASLACGCATTDPVGPTPGDLLPTPGFAEGWILEGPVDLYGPDTVFDHINGEAALYFPYGFEALASATYVHNGDPDDAITADVYVMGSLLDAFGIYSNYRGPRPGPVPAGAGGHSDGYQAMFYQDRYFVRLSASGNPEDNPPHLLACAKAVAGRLPGDDTPPPELALLDVDGIEPGTVRYIGESVLGYAFFPKGLLGEVRAGGTTVRALVVFNPSVEAAVENLQRYTAYLEEEGERPRRIDLKGATAMAATDPLYKGVLMRRCGSHLVGVIGLDAPATGAALVQQLADRVPK